MRIGKVETLWSVASERQHWVDTLPIALEVSPEQLIARRFGS
jgi:hypothetical protein